ncbi:NADH-quinone oxidoreductase subunit L [Haliangium ochraceum]|uniref:Proton-translocating NADH-quinone oxidoreductase, chain L n=1 Tax=Haliangium ochraceum (strain DSM 14365 / JCM 11303 / SMP-2) TaxID=502025 RepID=D0LZ05_HALO1|nr:NADH-quinone oxidoreductase subunit L [Haliangium ochraceum]ACY14475.1 proton-translocating NADH-quinone oxidoreductase, chain L [Haliangium ochraceum DSM 14365]
MQPQDLIFWIPLLPLLGATFNLFVGRVLWRWAFKKELPRGLVHFAAVLPVVLACVVSIVVIFVGSGSLFAQFQAFDATGNNLLEGLHQTLYTWIEIGTLKIDLAFRVDTLSSVMLLVITFIGSLIHIYSIGYMEHEPRYAAYFGYLNLFTGSMLILVLGDSLPVMFIGWEGVGLCSYLLIGFWFNETANADAGRKAFVVNRVGDFSFLIGMFLLFQMVGGLDYEVLRSDTAMSIYDNAFWGGERIAFWAGLFLFIGACGKSAQIPLYVWLPDAMAGPTPVSALIHAATMVTAGVYMVARLSFLYASSTTAMIIVSTVGALTALAAAFMAFAQTDFKKVLAYSTVSQLGFMFVGVGVGAYVAGVFHLITHAFFKAGLFLSAGSVMHAMSGSGDIMKMGGLRKYMPRTHGAFVVYWLAICGIVPFAGFFSKDEILAGAFFTTPQGWPPGYNYFLWAVLTLAALGTAFYMSRLYFLVFSGECRADEETKAHIHESPPSMTWPLILLAVGTALVGFIGLPHIEGIHLPTILADWLAPSLVRPDMEYAAVGQSLGGFVHAHSLGMVGGLMGLALVLGALGIFIGYKLYANGVDPRIERLTGEGGGLRGWFTWSKNKLYVDEAYDTVLVRPFRWIASAIFEFVDRFVIDLIFVNGAAVVTDVFGRVSRWVQNGQVHRYMFALLLGSFAIFFLTTRQDVDFSYERVQRGGVAKVRFVADVGSGPALMPGHVLRWDLDGDELPDLRPGVARESATEADYLSATVVEIDELAVGGEVTLWFTDPVFGRADEATKSISLGASASAAGGENQ